jgi:hypothetical protein
MIRTDSLNQLKIDKLDPFQSHGSTWFSGTLPGSTKLQGGIKEVLAVRSREPPVIQLNQ